MFGGARDGSATNIMAKGGVISYRVASKTIYWDLLYSIFRVYTSKIGVFSLCAENSVYKINYNIMLADNFSFEMRVSRMRENRSGVRIR